MYDDVILFHSLAENTNCLTLLSYLITAKRAQPSVWSRTSPPAESNITSLQCSEKGLLTKYFDIENVEISTIYITAYIAWACTKMKQFI